MGGSAPRRDCHLPVETTSFVDASPGRADEAVEVCGEIRRLCAEHGEQWVLSYGERILALAHAVKGDGERAEAHAREALRLKLAVHDVVGIGLTLDLPARIAADRGAHHRAALALGGADRVWTDVDRDRWGSACLNATRRAAEDRARAAIGAAAYRRSYDGGAALALPELAARVLDDTGEDGETDTGPARPDGHPEEPPAATVRLTRREAQVAALVAEGLANQQIADRLVIARRTAEGHVERILSKLGCSKRSQIAAWVAAQR